MKKAGEIKNDRLSVEFKKKIEASSILAQQKVMEEPKSRVAVEVQEDLSKKSIAVSPKEEENRPEASQVFKSVAAEEKPVMPIIEDVKSSHIIKKDNFEEKYNKLSELYVLKNNSFQN